jgi:hypothetical protein
MKKLILAMFLVLPWLGWGCIESPENLGPKNSFEKAYFLAIKGEIDKTSVFYSDNILNFLKTNQEMTLPKVWAGRLNDGTVKAVKIIESQLDDKKTSCNIKFMMVMNDGTMNDGEETMVFEKGSWKFDKMKRIR